MDIKTETMKRCELVVVSGQIDSSCAPELEQALLGIIDAGKKHIVVNLRDVPFVSSAGLKALISAQLRARKSSGGEIVLSELPDNLRDTFELVGLHRLLTIYERDIEAVGSF